MTKQPDIKSAAAILGARGGLVTSPAKAAAARANSTAAGRTPKGWRLTVVYPKWRFYQEDDPAQVYEADSRAEALAAIRELRKAK